MCSDRKILYMVENLGISTIDINKSILSQDDLSLYPFNIRGEHYGKAGYKILAELILQRINNDGYSKMLFCEKNVFIQYV